MKNHLSVFSRFLVILFISLIYGCVTKKPLQIEHRRITTPVYALDPYPQRIVLFSTYHVDTVKYRKNKKALFKKLIDSALITCKTELAERASLEAEIISHDIAMSNLPDSIFFLMKYHHATHAIVISGFDAGFEQTEVEVEKSQDGKSRTAYYDIYSDISYIVYSGSSVLHELQKKKTAPYSSRPVLSGLLAAGPNIVIQENVAWQITRANINDFLDLFFRPVNR